MLNRRQFLTRTLAGTTLLAVGAAVPKFLVNTALAAESGKDTVLVVIEMAGGNDGLNTVIPYTDDLYYKNRPTLGVPKGQVIKIDDAVGLNPGMISFKKLIDAGELAAVQGVGYPNPDRSHFESMDVWQSGDPKRQINTGWIGRSASDLQDKHGNVPIMHVPTPKIGSGFPLAVKGAPGGVVSLNTQQPYKLELGTADAQKVKERRKLIEDLAKPAEESGKPDLLQFVQRRQLQTYATLDKLQDVLKNQQQQFQQGIFVQESQKFYQGADSLPVRLNLIANLIQQNFGTRVFYCMIDGFDTHSAQSETQRNLLAEVADGITNFFNVLKQSNHDKHVLVMTFSEFGRRVLENGSKGTDHGAGSCLFVAGPGVKGGAVGKHPSLSDLDAGDLKYHTDFRQVYATLLDQWLNVDSKAVLGDKFEHLDMIKKA